MSQTLEEFRNGYWLTILFNGGVAINDAEKEGAFIGLEEYTKRLAAFLEPKIREEERKRVLRELGFIKKVRLTKRNCQKVVLWDDWQEKFLQLSGEEGKT